MIKSPNYWYATACIIVGIGLYFDKPDFEASLLAVLCVGVGAIIATIRDVKCGKRF